MATAKQSAASRANSLKSTGPLTAAGKGASCYNALKHGIHSQQQIMFDETEEDLAELAAEYHEQHAPASPTERQLVDTLIHNEWRLRRMRRVEAVLWEHAANSYLSQHPDEPACNSAHAFVTNSGAFERLQRVVNSCERNYHRALKELRAAQFRPAVLETPQPEESKPTSTSSASICTTPQTQAPTPSFDAPEAPNCPLSEPSASSRLCVEEDA